MTRAPSRAIAAPVGAAVNHPDSSGSASPDGSDDAFYEEIINEPGLLSFFLIIVFPLFLIYVCSSTKPSAQ